MRSFQAAYSVVTSVRELAHSVQAVAPTRDAHVIGGALAEESPRSVGPSVGLVEGQVLVYHDHSCVSGFVVHVMTEY